MTICKRLLTPFCQNFPGSRILASVFALVLMFALTSAVLHDFHTSLAEVEYNARSRNFEVAIRVFSDDLEKALRVANPDQKIRVDGTKASDPAVSAYMKKHFSISDSKRSGEINFIGTEMEGDVTWIYFEITGLDPKSNLSLQNLVLFESFDDQKNIVNVKIKDHRKTFLFDLSNRKYNL
jgi:hypothetical protein